LDLNSNLKIFLLPGLESKRLRNTELEVLLVVNADMQYKYPMFAHSFDCLDVILRNVGIEQQGINL